MGLAFHPQCFDELLGLLLTADRTTRMRVRGNLLLLEEFGPELVALLGLGGDPELHELRVDTEPMFGLVGFVDRNELTALTVYFDHGDARETRIATARERHART